LWDATACPSIQFVIGIGYELYYVKTHGFLFSKHGLQETDNSRDVFCFCRMAASRESILAALYPLLTWAHWWDMQTV